MIAASVGMVAAALLFVIAGLLRLGEGKECGTGGCGSCDNDCGLDIEGRVP